MRPTLLTTMAALLTNGAALQPAAAADARDNAALGYWRAWSVLDLSTATRGLIKDAPDPSAADFVIGDRMRQILDREDIMGLLERASQKTTCDFGVDTDRGIDALLPHLGPMRLSVRLLAIDARDHLEAGETDLAVARLATAYRIGAHCAEEPFLISALVSMACFAITDDAVAYAVEHGDLTEAHVETLRRALRNHDAADPFGIKRGIESERDILVPWLRRVLSGDDAVQRIRGFAPMAADGEHVKATIALVEKLRNGETLDDELDLLERYYDLVLEAWDRPDAVESVTRLGELVADGEMGHLAQLLAPAVGKVRARDDDGDAMLATAWERLGR